MINKKLLKDNNNYLLVHKKLIRKYNIYQVCVKIILSTHLKEAKNEVYKKNEQTHRKIY